VSQNYPFTFALSAAVILLLAELPDPKSRVEAMAALDAEKWVEAEQQEIENLHNHNVYQLVPHKQSMRVLGTRFVYHQKFINGMYERHKARLVVQGYQKIPGVDYQESFTAVMRFESLRTLISLAALENLDIIQFDIKSAYLHGVIKEEVHIAQPPGHAEPG
jgi:hypothetical protein